MIAAASFRKCEVRVERFDWEAYLSSYGLEEISGIIDMTINSLGAVSDEKRESSAEYDIKTESDVKLEYIEVEEKEDDKAEEERFFNSLKLRRSISTDVAVNHDTVRDQRRDCTYRRLTRSLTARVTRNGLKHITENPTKTVSKKVNSGRKDSQNSSKPKSSSGDSNKIQARLNLRTCKHKKGISKSSNKPVAGLHKREVVTKVITEEFDQTVSNLVQETASVEDVSISEPEENISGNHALLQEDYQEKDETTQETSEPNITIGSEVIASGEKLLNTTNDCISSSSIVPSVVNCTVTRHGLDDIDHDLQSGNLQSSDLIPQHVIDYGPYRVTRYSSDCSEKLSRPGSECPELQQSFTAYKERMQRRLNEKLENDSFGKEMDLDSDVDSYDDPCYSPTINDEQHRLDLGNVLSDDEDECSKSLIVMSDKYKCNTCDKTYLKGGHLWKHMKICSGLNTKIDIKLDVENIGEQSYNQCRDCGLMFSTPGSMRRHLLKIHNAVPDGQPKVLRSRMNVPSQKFIVQQNERPRPEGFSILKSKNVRQAELFKCVKCSKKFVKSGHLVKHMKVVHNSPDKFIVKVIADPDLDLKNLCDFCQRSFATPASLRRHLLVHAPPSVKLVDAPVPKKVEAFACKECGKRYQARPSLKRHVLTEHRGFKSKCNVCGMSVARLDNHMALHHQENLSSCNICHIKLAASCLARHIRTVHMGCLVRCVECDKFVSNIHKHTSHNHPMAGHASKDCLKNHLNCDCVFYLGPNSIYVQHTRDLDDD